MRPWLALALLAGTLLPGCEQAPDRPPVGTLVAGSLRFAVPSGGEREGDMIRWSFLVQNTAEVNSTQATLHMQVLYSYGSGTPDARATVVPPIHPGDAQVVSTATPFHGNGDYVGYATLELGGETVARDRLFFEWCAGLC